MTDSFSYLNYLQGGSVPGKFDIAAGAGSILTVLDYVLTQTSYPWTKTVVGTNIASYQAPAGNQIKITVEDEGNSSYLYARVRASVGSQTFPTVTQETTSGFGPVLIRKQSQAGALDSYRFGWFAWKTDRLLVLAQVGYTGSNQWTSASMLVAGDLPTASPADAGFCVLLGTTGASTIGGANSYLTASNYGNPWDYSSTSAFVGYAYTDFSGANLSPTVFQTSMLPATVTGSSLTLAQHGGVLPLLPVALWSSYDSTGSSSWTKINIRGFLPWIYATTRPSDMIMRWQTAAYADSGWDTFQIGAIDCLASYGFLGGSPAVIVEGDYEAMP